MADRSDLVRGTDGLTRCWWADAGPVMQRYHDVEWGRGARDEHSLFERLSLEALQAGLSWRIVLERRESLRSAFRGFVPARVAVMSDEELEDLLTLPGTIRNRAKVTAIARNAAVLMDLHAEGSSLLELTESSLAPYLSPLRPAPRRRVDIPGHTDASAALARNLRQVGWRFVGPTTAYAFLQASGWVDDHLLGCHARVTS